MAGCSIHLFVVLCTVALLVINVQGHFQNEKDDFKKLGIRRVTSQSVLRKLHSDPILWADKFQGDMVMPYEQVEAKFGKAVADAAQANGFLPSSDGRRLGITGEDILWPNETVGGPAIIPYDFETSGFSSSEESLIESAMDDLNIASGNGVKFVEKDATHDHWVRFQSSDSGCYSYVGKTTFVGSPQPINLAFGCVFFGIIQHEILHALGFYHEQSRPDRETYVTVDEDAILAGYESQFAIEDTIDSRGSDYDYDSVMHYGSTDFGLYATTCSDTYSTCNVAGSITTADATLGVECFMYDPDGSISYQLDADNCTKDWVLEEGSIGTIIHPADDPSLCLTGSPFAFPGLFMFECSSNYTKFQSWLFTYGTELTSPERLDSFGLALAGDPTICVDVFVLDLFTCNDLTGFVGDQLFTFEAETTDSIGCQDLTYGCDYVTDGFGFLQPATTIVSPEPIGQRDGISDEDANQLQALYPPTPFPPSSGTDGFIPGFDLLTSIAVTVGGGVILLAVAGAFILYSKKSRIQSAKPISPPIQAKLVI